MATLTAGAEHASRLSPTTPGGVERIGSGCAVLVLCATRLPFEILPSFPQPSISSSRSAAHIGDGRPEEALLGDILESLYVLSNLLRYRNPMMPHKVIFMHLTARIIGEGEIAPIPRTTGEETPLLATDSVRSEDSGRNEVVLRR